jgi:hypothetical protein
MVTKKMRSSIAPFDLERSCSRPFRESFLDPLVQDLQDLDPFSLQKKGHRPFLAAVT